MSPRRLYVRNFHRYQHYNNKTRQRPPWVKLHRSILEDEHIMALPPEHRWVAVGLVILASESEPEGESRRVVASEKEASRRLGVHPLTMRSAVKHLLKAGFLASSPLAGRKQKVLLEVEKEKELKALPVASYEANGNGLVDELIQTTATHMGSDEEVPF